MELFPYTNFHELNLDWIISKVKELIREWNDTENKFQNLYEYVMNYFKNLDVQEEINNKIDEMIKDGTLANIIMNNISNYHIYNVLNYGVVGDGVTDDTKNIQKILNEIPQGYTVYFPSGTYKVTDTLTVNKPINIVGDSDGTSPSNNIDCYSTIRLYANSGNKTLMEIKSGWVNILNIKFWSEASRMVDSGEIPSSTNHFRSRYFMPLLENVNGLDFSEAGNLCVVKNCSFVGFSGFTINSNIYGIISDCFFHYNYGECVLNSDIEMNNCIFSYNEMPLNVKGNASSLNNIHIDESCSYGLTINGSYNMLSNIYIDQCPYSAIKFNYSVSNKIEGVVLRCCNYWTGTDFNSVEITDEHFQDFFVIQIYGSNGGYHTIKLNVSNSMTFDDTHTDKVDPMFMYIDKITSRIFAECLGLYKTDYPTIDEKFVYSTENYDVTINYGNKLLRFFNGKIYTDHMLMLNTYDFNAITNNIITRVNDSTYFKAPQRELAVDEKIDREYASICVNLGFLSIRFRGTATEEIPGGTLLAYSTELSNSIPNKFNSGYVPIYNITKENSIMIVGTLNINNGKIEFRNINTISNGMLIICNASINLNGGNY